LSEQIIDPLPPIDHSTISYDPFEKHFYNEHPEIESMSSEQVNDLRKTLGITVTGYNAPRPVCSFAHFNFDEQLMKVIRKSGFTQPTPIQAQVLTSYDAEHY
jgi:ATP-dependent RNA helicase DDX42